MAKYIFDCETNGLLHNVTTLHSLVLKDIDTNEIISAADQPGYIPLAHALSLLEKAELVSGHNVIKYDLPVLTKLYPEFKLNESCKVIDTLVLSRLWRAELEPLDYSRWSHIEPAYKGRHSLAA